MEFRILGAGTNPVEDSVAGGRAAKRTMHQRAKRPIYEAALFPAMADSLDRATSWAHVLHFTPAFLHFLPGQ